MDDKLDIGTESLQERDERIALLGKALGHPARLHILRLLLSQPVCSGGNIFDALPLAQSTVSQHLKVLRQAGLINYEPRGSRGCYWAERDILATLAADLGKILSEAAEETGDPGTCSEDEEA